MLVLMFHSENTCSDTSFYDKLQLLLLKCPFGRYSSAKISTHLILIGLYKNSSRSQPSIFYTLNNK